ncbi:predicted protein [Naegleria gruberi]|uniref:Predicted protein n=1 Tax=Naegleria gruberi TaxID=5762 RepID=D2W5S0_NAEGR|nr:uncharacterized protein NAEGRDRAFT_76763 [Naegleria gruberi]EFC35582.1 predicted protein [Naegleria gruberi]|eukprot:XP_002668326.1 predicted protein [Naegleria gruberi strain NEG-M]
MCKGGVERGQLKEHQEKHCPLHDAYKQVDELKETLKRKFNDKLEKEYAKRTKILENTQHEVVKLLQSDYEKLVKQTKQDFEQRRDELTQEFELKEQSFKIRVNEFENSVVSREKLEASNKPIHLNVRGKIMTVSLGDFIHNEREPDNLFKKMFTGQHPCYQTQCSTFNSDPVYFIDCDPIVFKHIIEWLQYGAIAIELSNDVKRSLLNTCKKFELKNIINELENEESTRLNLKNFVNLHKIQKRSLNFKYYNFNDLSACDFSGMNLESSNFKMLILKGCDFSNCNLTNANFIECDMIECNLSNSILNNTNISKSNLSGAKIDVCELIQKVDFSRCNLSNICFKQFKFDNVIFTNSIIDGSKFENITFEKCKIKTHFKKNNGLINCKYIACDFTGTIFEEIDFKLIEPSLSTTLFSNCTFKNSDLGK